MSEYSKSQKLLQVAGRTLDDGDRSTAKDLVVLALKQEDAIDTLNGLLPSMPVTEFEVEEESLSESQVAKILSLAKDLQNMKKFKIANQILAKVEKLESQRKRKPRV